MLSSPICFEGKFKAKMTLTCNTCESLLILTFSFKAGVGNPRRASKSPLHFENKQPIHPIPSYLPSRQSYAHVNARFA